MYKNIISMVCIVGVIVGCGSSGSPMTVKTEVVGYNGFLVDSPVSGASWSCGGVSGITGADGGFGTCPVGSEVTFRVGNLVLGVSEPTEDLIFTTQDLVGVARDKTDNGDTIKLATLLLSMDFDGDPSNGIQITTGAIETLNQSVTEEQNLLDLPTEESDKIVDRMVEYNPNIDEAPTPEDAKEHLQDTNGDIADGTQRAGSMERRPIQDESTN
jgi:uncharacterized coiled-coil protein SlyX